MAINKEAIAKTVIKIVAEKLGRREETITVKTKFMDDLGADSLDQVELLMSFEDEYNIHIRDGEADSVRTVQDAVDLIILKLED